MEKKILAILVGVVTGFSAFNTTAQAATVTYIYDDLDRVQNVVLENKHLADYQYDPANNRTQEKTENVGKTAVASLAAVPYNDSDFVVYFDASGSACFDTGIAEACDLTLDFGGTGTIVGGTGTDVWVYQYDAGGTFDATLTVAFASDPTIIDTQTITVSSLQLAPTKQAIDFTTVVNSDTVTLTATIPENIVSATVYWGDRGVTESANPQEDFQNGIAYSYARVGRNYNIRVQTVVDLDSNDNTVDYTFVDDGDLTVIIP